MFNRLSAQNGVFRLPPIQRKNNKELDVAIADLEARGFRLVRRGIQNEKKQPHSSYNKVWAIMEKLMT
ncbi:hypothetical protein FCT18_19970 [Lysinibacillus sphaericus]|uniref:Uncharacterized protein n=3 Tax=Lysinibacillus TaxID=400634 RepID=A0A2S0K0C7_LYSSH|nr:MULTISPECIES: hypothetical protein [Lysinibacillus]AHN24202.1 hypothetical protein T479_11785 [Lysinibacillus varians]AVK96791.1 hypothetical protein LS41612_11185 [Lysinibacillus sphaericus]MCS1384556.1 hypothetical protein [Lysinibacillus sphaericus]MED4545748.1 hypothetical protein [Lysinibacillus sphaericus]TKI16693.1 hypothetical protein FCT18_19970 [Lysinibacillus sphaericus]